MKWLKNIAGRVFAVYGLLLFVATLLIVLVPIWIISFFPDPRKTRYFLNIGRVWMGVYMPLIGCPVFRKGLQYFKKGQQYAITTRSSTCR